MAYQGIFMRQFAGQTPSQPGTGWTQSPDIMPVGASVAADPTVFSQQANYNQTYAQSVTMNQWNYVYFRGINTTAGAQNAKVYLYYVESTQLNYPSNWNGPGDPNIQWAGNVQNYAPLTATAQNGLAASTPPLQWFVPPYSNPGTGDHYVLIAWIDNGSNPPPNFSSMGYMSTQDLATYLTKNPQMTVLDTTAVSGRVATSVAISQFVAPANAVSVQVQAGFPKVPRDGTFSINIPGTDSTNTITSVPIALPPSAEGYYWTASYPASFATALTINYWQGNTPAPAGSKIVAKVLVVPSSGPGLVHHQEWSLDGAGGGGGGDAGDNGPTE
ncbi:MAG: hypothetical protein M3328_17355 [Chloroflexota bacterium]|nr:hypothetical protein [Chloroflexota bacterium]